MSFSWEPRWEKIIVESHGIVVRTCRDRITKMIACPICVNAAITCLDEENSERYEPKLIFFYSFEDLIQHIRDYHVYRAIRKKFLEKDVDDNSDYF
ncbi:MAG: hypothetical protein QXT88_02740 [Desulfurococcaceae archaeon]|uniref:Uncharacterized protein n=1 Tax=Staphylothermus marinus TaxID=2280 RepID=A0A7C4JLZ5_STAMA